MVDSLVYIVRAIKAAPSSDADAQKLENVVSNFDADAQDHKEEIHKYLAASLKAACVLIIYLVTLILLGLSDALERWDRAKILANFDRSPNNEEIQSLPAMRTRKSGSSIAATMSLLPLAFIPFTLFSIFSNTIDNLCRDTLGEDLSPKLMTISIVFAVLTEIVFIFRLPGHFTSSSGNSAVKIVDKKLKKRAAKIADSEPPPGRKRWTAIWNYNRDLSHAMDLAAEQKKDLGRCHGYFQCSPSGSAPETSDGCDAAIRAALAERCDIQRESERRVRIMRVKRESLRRTLCAVNSRAFIVFTTRHISIEC